jgi:hypothetical protein
MLNINNYESHLPASVNQTAAIENSFENIPNLLETSIIKLANDCSKFVDAIIPNSETKDIAHNEIIQRIGMGKQYEVSGKKFLSHENIITRIRAISQDNASHSQAGEMAFFIEGVCLAIKSNSGNCGEKSLACGALFLLLLENHLSHQGFSKDQITDANIEVFYADNTAGDHAVCLVKVNDVEILLDSWSDGAVIDKKDIKQFYSDLNGSHFCKGKNANFTASSQHTDILNNPEFLSKIKNKIADIFGVDFNAANPLSNYEEFVQRTQESHAANHHQLIKCTAKRVLSDIIVPAKNKASQTKNNMALLAKTENRLARAKTFDDIEAAMQEFTRLYRYRRVGIHLFEPQSVQDTKKLIAQFNGE